MPSPVWKGESTALNCRITVAVAEARGDRVTFACTLTANPIKGSSKIETTLDSFTLNMDRDTAMDALSKGNLLGFLEEAYLETVTKQMIHDVTH